MRDDSEFLIEDVLQMNHKIYHKEDDSDNGDDMIKLAGGRKLKTKNPPLKNLWKSNQWFWVTRRWNQKSPLVFGRREKKDENCVERDFIDEIGKKDEYKGKLREPWEMRMLEIKRAGEGER